MILAVSKFNQTLDLMVVVDANHDKDLNNIFWSDLGGPSEIRWPELIHTGIIRFLRVLRLFLLPEKDKKIIYK